MDGTAIIPGPSPHGRIDRTTESRIQRERREFAAEWKRRFNRMECGEDEVSDEEREMYAALAETRRINRMDGRDVAALIHEIDH
ncbi:MAG: hypothetical protein IT428_17100 [Planctomycetaceae bacterium]|nr:hypothetical protein [Planctomycetaceae bacterium]